MSSVFPLMILLLFNDLMQNSTLYFVDRPSWCPWICNNESVFACLQWSWYLWKVVRYVVECPWFVFFWYFHVIGMKLFIFCEGYHRNYIAFFSVAHIKGLIMSLIFITCDVNLYHLVRVASGNWEFMRIYVLKNMWCGGILQKTLLERTAPLFYLTTLS